MTQKLKNMWSKRIGNELYVFHNGVVIYKRWYKRGSLLKQASVLLNKYWPTEWLP